ncbi:MAG TPA: LysM peptidoglycan-binding domain-containing protein [bacterium]
MRSRVSQTVTCAVLVVLAIPAIAAASHTHVVRPGDTLWSIARRYEVSVEALASANQLADPDALRLGQELIIPNAGERQASSAPSNARLTHVVTAGDTLWSLARRYQVPVQTLVEANRLENPDALRLGQTLVIPGGEALRPSRPGVPAAGQSGSGALRRPLPAAVVPSRGAKWGSALLASASRYVGVRYRWGGMSPRGFDCSGFIGYVMRAVGVSVPRTTDAMWATGRVVTREQLKVGDVVFFTTTRPGPSHAGIYIGNNQFIHASSGFGRVTVTSLDYRYYRPRYLGARRF